MRFYFIRHAQSANNQLWDNTGSSEGRSEDPELTSVGKMQATLLAEFIRDAGDGEPRDDRDPQNHNGFGLTHLYCSPMIRAIETGLEVARAVDLPLTVWKDLHEGGGIYLDDDETGEEVGQAGNTRSYLAKRFPDLVLTDEIADAGWWNRPFEKRDERMERAYRFLSELRERHGGTDDRVAVFSHGAFFNYFLSAVLNHSKQDGLWFLMNNTAISRLDFMPDFIDIVYTNRCNFLPREMIT